MRANSQINSVSAKFDFSSLTFIVTSYLHVDTPIMNQAVVKIVIVSLESVNRA
jgi:hypothetical protein